MQLKNTLTIRLRGGYAERLLNLCSMRGICILHAEAHEDTLIVCIRTRDLKRLRTVLKVTGMRMHILKKEGIAHTLRKHRGRRFFALGFAFFICTLLLFSSFIWSISVVGNKNLTENEIKSLLSSCGFRSGVLKYRVNIHNIKESVLEKEPRLAWLWVTVQGTRATVEVKERTLVSAEDSSVPRDIVAACPGIITSLSVLSGAPAALVGDTVTQGQLLISRQTPTGRITHANGIVLARTWHTLSEQIHLAPQLLSPSGETSTTRALMFNRRILPLGYAKPTVAHGVTSVDCRRLYLFQSMPLPIFVLTMRTAAATPEPHATPPDAAVSFLETLLVNRLRATLPRDAAYVSHNISATLLPNHILEVTLTAEVLADIGVPSDG